MSLLRNHDAMVPPDATPSQAKPSQARATSTPLVLRVESVFSLLFPLLSLSFQGAIPE